MCSRGTSLTLVLPEVMLEERLELMLVMLEAMLEVMLEAVMEVMLEAMLEVILEVMLVMLEVMLEVILEVLEAMLEVTLEAMPEVVTRRRRRIFARHRVGAHTRCSSSFLLSSRSFFLKHMLRDHQAPGGQRPRRGLPRLCALGGQIRDLLSPWHCRGASVGLSFPTSEVGTVIRPSSSVPDSQRGDAAGKAPGSLPDEHGPVNTSCSQSPRIQIRRPILDQT